jgi:hypothetical protein
LEALGWPVVRSLKAYFMNHRNDSYGLSRSGCGDGG